MSAPVEAQGVAESTPLHPCYVPTADQLRGHWVEWVSLHGDSEDDAEKGFDRWLATIVAHAGAIGVRAAAAGIAQLDLLEFDRPHEYAEWLNDLADVMDTRIDELGQP